MNKWDIILTVLIAAAAGLAVFFAVRARKKGCGCGCAGCMNEACAKRNKDR